MRWLLVESSTFPAAIPHTFYGDDVTITFRSVTDSNYWWMWSACVRSRHWCRLRGKCLQKELGAAGVQSGTDQRSQFAGLLVRERIRPCRVRIVLPDLRDPLGLRQQVG